MKDLNISIDSLLKDIQAISVGLPKNSYITSLCTDSRKLEKGDWFICLKGENFNAHQFVPQVLEKKPAGIIFEKTYPFDKKVKGQIYGIAVEDSLKFFSELAAWYRKRIDCFVIALTGSNGKTSAKEILYHLLSSVFDNVQKTQGNFNNHFGLPMTLLSLKKETKFLVVEIGSNHKKEISPLSKFAAPQISAIISIAESHIGNFKDIQEIALEKASIADGLQSGGIMLLPDNLTQISQVENYCQNKNILLKKISIKNSADLELKQIEKNGTSFYFNKQEFFFPYSGEHQFQNLQLMFAIFQEILAQKKIVEEKKKKIFVEALENLIKLPSVKGRLHPIEFLYKNFKLTIWDDCYNANFTSFKVAIDFLSLQNLKEKTAKNLWAAVGQMAELGEHAEEQHYKLGNLFARKNFTRVAFFSNQKEIQEAFKKGFTEAYKIQEDYELEFFKIPSNDNSLEKATHFFLEKVETHVDILIKGSNSSGMKYLLQKIEEKL